MITPWVGIGSLGAGTKAWSGLLIYQKTAWNRKEHTYATWNVWRKPQPWNKEQETALLAVLERKHRETFSRPSLTLYSWAAGVFKDNNRGVEVFVLWVWIITPALYGGPALFTNRSFHMQSTEVNMGFYHIHAAAGTFLINTSLPTDFFCLCIPHPNGWSLAVTKFWVRVIIIIQPQRISRKMKTKHCC